MCRWILSFESNISIEEPLEFSGNELSAIEFAPNLIKRTLILMKIDKKEDQDKILKEILKLVSKKTKNEKVEENDENVEKPKKPDIWE